MSELTEQNLTRQQAEQEMACLRKIYASVRLLDPKMLVEEPCYPPWKNVHPCTSCVGREAMAGKCQCSKLETLGSSLYQVTARYVEVDGKSYVMEMILPLDASARSSLHSNELIYRDALTGAYNRRFYEEELKHKYLNAGVAMIDLDDFKLCNDTYGHSAGDAALRLIVSIIHRCIRSTDMLVRYGGDELLLILPDISAEAFVRKLKDINKRLFAAHLPEFEKMHVSASIGGVMTAGIPISDALLIADKRMYLAKRRKNTVVAADIAPDAVCSENEHRPMVLIVDDSPMNRDILSEILCDDFEILEAPNGPKCLELLNAWGSDISIVLLDIVMPDMDGFDVLSRMSAQGWLEEIPIVMISSEDSSQTVRRAYELGASDYISRPFDARIVHRRVSNVARLYARQRRLSALVSQQFYDREKNDQIMIGILSQVTEIHNSESIHHISRVQRITSILLERLCQKTDIYGLSGMDRYLITTASALHDIGKVAIDDRILNAHDPTPEQTAILHTHPILGAQMLENLSQYQDEPLVKFAIQICRWHHERWDGNGYPDRLKGDEIPISAQVVALADVYDALTSERCYKHAYDHDTALRMILNGECGTFNPLLLDCLQESSEQLRTELTRSEWDRGFRQETHRLSEEILHREALPRENHSQLLLEQEKERTDFYAAQCGGIRFDYDLLAGSVTVYDYHAEPLQQKTVADFAQGRGLGFLNEQDRRKLSKAISRATPEAPDVVLPVMVQRDGKPHLHRMALHTIWSGAGVRRCVNVLGQLTDEQHRVEHQTELLTATDPEEHPAQFLRRLQGIFDVVRLVDPEHRKVLALDSDGILTEKPGNCHMVWNRDTRCENCISATAYARKTILNKIEFKDEEAYFVISKYIEVGGRGCMLEMVTRLTDGRWLDMGGHRLLLDRCDGMERSAFVDPLTGAYTRRYFDKFLAGGEMHGGVAMIDVDQFKSVNDSFGHLVGDEALQTVAAAMQSCLRQTDILIRYGGDEFLLLMPQNCPDGVESVIRRVRDAVQAARVPSHPELRLSVSIGGVCNVQPLTEAIRQADARMYCNKENGEQVL